MSRSDIRSHAALTISQSAVGGQGGTMLREGNNITGIGAGGTTGPMAHNSGMAVGESEMDIEFGYLSEEESIFQSFSQDVERILPKIKKTFTMKDDIKGTKSSIKDVFKRYTEHTRTFEFMIKFKIEMDSEDSSSIYSASGTTPINIIDERDKKKFLKVSQLLSKHRSIERDTNGQRNQFL